MIETATNPQTGERLALVNGKWEPITDSATNDKGHKAYFVGGQWLVDESTAPATPKKETPSAAPAPKKAEPTFGDKAASVATSGIMGLGNTMLGLAQGLAHSVPEIEMGVGKDKKAVLAGGAAKQTDENINSLFKFKDKLREKAGFDGFDVTQLFGNLADPLAYAGANKFVSGVKAAVPAGAATLAANTVGAGALSGAAYPVVGKDYDKGKNEQITTGAVFSVLMKAAGAGASKGSDKIAELIRPFTETGRARMLYDYIDKLSGSAKADIVKALQSVKEYVPGSKATGGEAVADLPEATALASFLRHLEGVKGDMKEQPVSAMYAKRRAEQEAARLEAVRSVGRDAASLETAQSARKNITTPMRDDALSQANIGGVKTPQLLADIEARQASKAAALQAAGRAQSVAADQTTRSRNMFPVEPELYPIMQKVQETKAANGLATTVEDPNLVNRVIGKDGKLVDLTPSPREKLVDPNKPNFMVPGFPKVSEKFTPQNARAGEWTGAARDATTIAKQRQLEKDFKEFQLKSLQDEGYLPLMADPVVAKVNKMANTPGASTITKEVFSKIRDKIAERTKENGVIDARDLYTIRKEIGNDIATLAKDSNTWDKQVTGGLEKNIQSAIDAAIEKAGGTGWKTYLNTFKDMSKPINQMEIGQFLEKKLTSPLEGGGERAVSFANAVREAPSTIKKASGQSRYSSLEEVLDPAQMASISGVKADLERAKKFKDLAGKTHEGDPGELSGKLVAPGLISTAASITNWGLKILRSGAEEKIATLAGKLDQNPQALATFMSKVPRTKVTEVAKQLSDRVSPESRQIIQMYVAKQAGAATNE